MKDPNGNIDFSLVLASSVHDMKNSIGMLLGSLEQLIDQTPAEDFQATKHFNTLHYEASRINNELVQLLTIYRMQNDFLPVRIDEYYVIDVLEEQIARNQMLLDTANIKLILDCDTSLVWYYDQDLIASLIHNIVVNCARYTKSVINISVTTEDEMLCIAIADDGGGYPKHMLQNPLGKLDDIELSKNATHLGLFFAERIAALHKQGDKFGFIRLENGPPLGGGVFKVFVP